MAQRSAFQEGSYTAACAVEEDRRLGIPKDQVLIHYLSEGIQGAINAANNTYGEDAALELREQYAVGWLAALVRLRMTNCDVSVLLSAARHDWGQSSAKS